MTNEIENIEDHIAFTCACGSVHFNLLKSGQIECSNCHAKRGAWPEKRKFTPEVDESNRAQNDLHGQIYRREQTKAELDVIAERRRQIEVEGFTPEHDDEHDSGELADVAACYALGVYSDRSDAGPSGDIPPYWPKSLDESWWNPKDKRRNLVRAAALLIAEIERLDRAAMAKGE